METKKTYQIGEVVLLVLALLFTAVGCERELTKPIELKESVEQTQSLNEAPPAGEEAEELGVKIERNVPVPMRDGTILRADVHRPDRGGPYPVLVRRTPYGKDRRLSLNRFVTAGYIVVNQDARGRYESEGKWESAYRFETHDAEDGYDTVEWAAKLPRSTSKVGTFGMSYDAFLQWRLAPLHPPSLMCMSAYMGGAASLTDAEGPAGIRPGIAQWWAMMAADMRRRENMPGVHTVWEARKLREEKSEKWIYWLPWLELPGDFFGYETDAAKHWLKNPHIDPWKLDEGIKEITVPNLDITGWYDYGNDDMLLFRTMIKEAKTEVARKGSRIIIGPWSHARRLQRRYGDIDFGPDALLDRTAMQIRWFDYWLKGKQNGAEKDAPVRIFVMGDNQWRDEQHWPLRRTKKRILFITSDGHANTPRGDGKLVIERPESSNTDKYVYDPKDPVPTPYGTQNPIAADQRSLANRQDILVYLTEPLTERLEVTGNPVVELYAASSAPDTDWFVRLIDVAPDGLARDASSGMVRARYRKGLDRPKLIKPGEVVKYTIRMSPTSNAFLPGHRIRLDITSSDFPFYDRNHNTAANQYADATLVTAKQTIYHGGEQATRIILPWVPNPIEEEPTEEEKPEPKPRKKMYQFHQAAADGDIKQVKLLISKGTDLDARDEKEKTPLDYAAETGKMGVVQLLVEAGADVNAMGNNDWPPLCIAAENNHIAVSEYLIAHGADVNPDNGWTPLQQAPYSNSIEMVKLLIAKGADINAGEGKWTALHGAVSEGRRDIAELLIQKGANVNTKDKTGYQPLYYAVWKKDLDTAKLLITKGANVNTKNKTGYQPLFNAVWKKDLDTAKLLIAKGADVNAGEGEWTALHYAVSEGRRDIAELLIQKGANVNTKDKSGLTALHYAAVNEYQDIANLLLTKGAKVDAKDDVYEFTALHYAARFGSKNVAEVLIANGANINTKDKWDYQPIHWAAHHDRADVVELLISKGADINAKTSLGQTPLQLAKIRRNTETIELLRKHGAKE